MSALKKMVAVSGFDPEPEAELQLPESGRLTVTGNPMGSALARAGRGIAANGGGYAAASVAGAGVCALAGVNPMLDLLVVGACGAHGVGRVWDGYAWHVRGGRAAAKRRRKYQGEATPSEVRAKLSPNAAAQKMKRLAPGLPADKAHLPIGTTVHRPRQRVAVSRAETVAVFGVPQSLKTALISHWVLEAPGAVLATSSRGDQYRHTVLAREKTGPVHVLDADGFGPGTTFAWDPVAGCEDAAVAMRRAGAFMDASPRDPGGKDRWHEDRGARLLRLALHAAALTGGSMYDVLDWTQQPDSEAFLKALRHENAAPRWVRWLESLLTEGADYIGSAVTSASAALGWMDDPALAAVATPDRGTGLDLGEFLRGEHPGSVYLIGRQRAYGSLTPFFGVFATEYLEQLRELAERQGGRLRTPALIAADEAATTARIDLKSWLPVTAGYNITTVVGLQSVRQLETTWGGPAEAEVLLDQLSTKVIAGGFTSMQTLQALSGICGERETWRKQGGAKVYEKEPVFPPERLRQLPDFNALVIQRNAKPVQVEVHRVWDHSAYQELVITDAPEQPASAGEPEE